MSEASWGWLAGRIRRIERGSNQGCPRCPKAKAALVEDFVGRVHEEVPPDTPRPPLNCPRCRRSVRIPMSAVDEAIRELDEEEMGVMSDDVGDG